MAERMKFMASIPFPHPYSETRTHLFLDLYYKYYDLIRLRHTIQKKICRCIEFGSIIEPELPGAYECDLIVIENEEAKVHSEPKGKTSFDDKTKLFKKFTSERHEIFSNLEKDESGSWEESKFDEHPDNLKKLVVQFRYVEFKVDKLKNDILALRESKSIRDPFEYLGKKFKLMEEEIELLIFIYYSNFDCSDAIRGDILLNIVIGKQWKLFSIQNMLFDDSDLIKNDLIQIVLKGYDALSSYYAISNYSNLIISDLYPDFRHLTGKLKNKTRN